MMYLFLIVVSTMMFGCTERNTPHNYGEPSVQTGYIQCLNNTSDPYIVTIKGNTSYNFTLESRKSITKTVEIGYYNVHVKQQSGYLFYATEKDYEFYVTANKTNIVSF